MQKYFWLCILLSLWVSACGGRYPIQKNGLPYLSIGEPMPPLNQTAWQGYPSRDTLFEEAGFRWRGIVVAQVGGSLLIESDFDTGDIVNRIRVESPGLTTRKRLQVGSTVADLQRKWVRWRAFYFPQYGLVDISAPGQPTIHYLVRETQLPEAVLSAEDLQFSQLSEDSPIVAIVVM